MVYQILKTVLRISILCLLNWNIFALNQPEFCSRKGSADARLFECSSMKTKNIADLLKVLVKHVKLKKNLTPEKSLLVRFFF